MSEEETDPIRFDLSDDGRTMTFTKRTTGEIVCQVAATDEINFNDWTPEQRRELVVGILTQVPETEGTPENPLVTSFAVVAAEPEE